MVYCAAESPVGRAVTALLTALHIHVKHPQTPISNSFAMEVIVMLVLIIFFVAVRTRLSVDQPGGLQHVMEGIEGFVGNMGEETIGHHYHFYLSYLVTLGLFILTCNLIGLIPGFESPTEFRWPVGMCAADLVLLPLPRAANQWFGIL